MKGEGLFFWPPLSLRCAALPGGGVSGAAGRAHERMQLCLWPPFFRGAGGCCALHARVTAGRLQLWFMRFCMGDGVLRAPTAFHACRSPPRPPRLPCVTLQRFTAFVLHYMHEHTQYSFTGTGTILVVGYAFHRALFSHR